jgi:hypothetical protein
VSPELMSELDINTKILAIESDLDRIRLNRRLLKLALTIAPPILLSLVIVGNIFIDFSKPGGGRFFLNLFGLTSVVGSVAGPSIKLYLTREETREHELEISTLREVRKELYPPQSLQGADSVHRQYRDETLNGIDEYRAAAKYYRRIHNILQSIIIAGSIIAASVTSAIGAIPIFKLVAPIISMLVGISAGMTGYFKFRERSLNLQKTADSIEQEYTAVDLRIRRYKHKAHDEALVLFAEEVENLKEEQRKREQQLEQPPESRQETSR